MTPTMLRSAHPRLGKMEDIMRKLTNTVVLTSTLLLALFGGWSVALADGLPPNAPYIECQHTKQVQVRSYLWTNNGRLSGYDQRLDVFLNKLVDANTGVFCNEMRTVSVLNYRYVSNPSYVYADLNDAQTGQLYPDKVYVPPYTGSSNYHAQQADTGLQVVNCGFAHGQWFDPGVINITIPSGIDTVCG